VTTLAYLRTKYVPTKSGIYGPYWELVQSVRTSSGPRQIFIRYFGKGKPSAYDKNATKEGNPESAVVPKEPTPEVTPYSGSTVKPELVGKEINMGERQPVVYSHTYDGMDIYIEKGSTLDRNDIAMIKELTATMTEGQKSKVKGLLIYESASKKGHFSGYFYPGNGTISIFNVKRYKTNEQKQDLTNTVSHEAGHVTFDRLDKNRKKFEGHEEAEYHKLKKEDHVKNWQAKQDEKITNAWREQDKAGNEAWEARKKGDALAEHAALQREKKSKAEYNKLNTEKKEFDKSLKYEARQNARKDMPKEYEDAQALDDFTAATTKEGYVTSYSKSYKGKTGVEKERKYNENLAESFANWRTGIIQDRALMKGSDRTPEQLAKDYPETHAAFKKIEKMDDSRSVS
jgi:hypothetical protein